MILENAYYVARGITDRGREIWSKPIHGLRCSSIHVKHTTVEELGVSMLSFYTDPDYLVKVEVFKVPDVPILTQTSPGKGRFQPVNA